jgi:rhodanese-related sulfurtransferase
LFGALARLFRSAPPEPRWIAVGELRAQLGAAAPPQVVDVRGPDEFDGPLGHIEGALNIPLQALEARRAEVAARRRLVFVCLTDKRSSAAAAQFAAAGRPDVFVLRGGMKAWREAG